MIFTSYIRNNSEAFQAKLKTIASALRADVNDLMAVMYLESRVNPQAVNPNGGATGLIQFMPATAAGLGTSTAALYAMSNVQQLDYVYLYFKPYTGRLNSFADVYGVTFFPLMIGKPDDWVLQTSTLSAAKIAQANKIFDLNKNNSITAGEFRTAIYNLLPVEIALLLRTKQGAAAVTGFGIVGLLGLTAGVLFLMRSLKIG